MFANPHFFHPVSPRSHRVWIAAWALLLGASAGATEIGGLVSLDEGGSPVTDGYVQIYRASGAYIGLASIGDDGRYRYSGLAPDSYVARTTDTGALDELWNNIPCPQEQCIVTSGTPIVVGSQPVVADFSLATGGAIAGAVTVLGTGAPIGDGYVFVYDAAGTYLGLTGIRNDGSYRYSGLAAGSYRVRTDSTGFADEIWDNQPCAQGACTYSAGSPVVVAAGSATTVANFALGTGGAIAGTVSAAAGGGAIGDGYVQVYDATGDYLGLVGIANDGSFRYGGLAPGSYFVRTDSTGYFDELWDNLPCADGVCEVTQGTPVAVASATVQLAFSLQSGGGIRGTVTREGSSTPVTDGYVIVHGANGGYLGLTGIENDGTYAYTGLASGTYFARTSDTGRFDEVWNNLACSQAQCIVSQGTPIAVGQSLVTADFALAAGGAIAGSVTGPGGAAVTDGYVVLYGADGDYLGLSGIRADGTYRYSGLAAGPYFLRTDDTGALDELWDNLPCAQSACNVRTGTPIFTPANTDTVADFALAGGIPNVPVLFANGFEAANVGRSGMKGSAPGQTQSRTGACEPSGVVDAHTATSTAALVAFAEAADRRCLAR